MSEKQLKLGETTIYLLSGVHQDRTGDYFSAIEAYSTKEQAEAEVYRLNNASGAREYDYWTTEEINLINF